MEDIRKTAINTWTGGMNKDTDEAYVKPNQYLHAENLRVISDGENKSGSLNNIPGNIESIPPDQLWTSKVYAFKTNWKAIRTKPGGATNISYSYTVNSTYYPTQNISVARSPLDFHKQVKANIEANDPFLKVVYNKYWMIIYTTDKSQKDFVFSLYTAQPYYVNSYEVLDSYNKLNIIGSGYIRDDIIIFTAPFDESAGAGQLWKLNYNDTNNPPTATIELIYNNILNFSVNHPIREAKGNWENDDCKKIYFTDEHNYLRHFNIADTNCFATPPEIMDILGDVNLSKPKLDNVLNGGSLTCGEIQYSYRLYNKYGSETSLSPTSNMIHVAKGNDFGSNDYDYFGGSGTDSANKSLSISFDNLDLRYGYIKIYSVKYNDGFNVPDITLVGDIEIDSDNLIFVDDGNKVLAAVTIDEFNVYGKVLFKCKTMDSKNNLLVVGNTSGEDFDIDFDARAYSFEHTGMSGAIIDSNTNTYSFDNTFQINGAPIPDESDAINPDNSIYRYIAGPTRKYGATGPNVEMTINAFPLQIQSYSMRQKSSPEPWDIWFGDSDFVDNKSSFTGYASPFNSGQLRGYTRDETYRFGIVFYSKKGLRSRVKWICDYKMPSCTDKAADPNVPICTLPQSGGGNPLPIYDYGITKHDYTSQDEYAIVIHPEFKIDIPQSISDKISGFEIVRMPRSDNDRTVVGQGVIGHVRNPIVANPDVFWDTLATGVSWSAFMVSQNQNVNTFACPEAVVYRNMSYNNGDRIRLINTLDDNLSSAWNQTLGITQLLSYCKGTQYINDASTRSLRDLSDCKMIFNNGNDTVATTDNGGNVFKFRNTWYDTTNATYPAGIGGTEVLLHVDHNQTFPYYTDPIVFNNHTAVLANYYRTVQNQYGGNKYEDRLLDRYITTGTYSRVLSDGQFIKKCFGGDTFICMFDYLRSMCNLAAYDAGNPAQSDIVIFPVETTINLDLFNDKSWRKIRDEFSTIQESKTVFRGVSKPNYDQNYSLYQYNPAYSRASDVTTFFDQNAEDRPDPKDQYDTRLRVSDRKINGNYVDHWTNFLFNNYLDVNTNRGAVTKIINHKNIIYVFQNNGFGVASIDDRSIVTDKNQYDIVLGNGGILQRFDYISNSSGTAHQFSVFNSDTAIYYFDQTDRQIKVFMGDDGSVSDNFGVKSFIYNNVKGDIIVNDNPFTGYGVNGYFDERYNECVFSFHKNDMNAGGNFTISFNESSKSFNGFYTFISPLYIRHYGKIISVYKDINQPNGDSLWLHNFGEYNKFYGNKYPSKLHVLINDNYNYTKVFDSVKIDLEASDATSNILTDFFHVVRCYNNHQNSDWNYFVYNTTPATGKQVNYDRRERTYSFQIPRNMVDADIQTNPNIFDPAVLTDPDRPFRERMRSRTLHLELIYNDQNNNKIKFPLITTTYRLSAR